MDPSRSGDAERAGEREFFRRLLELAREGEIAPLLDHALSLIVESTGARLGYLELHHDHVRGPGFWRARGCSAEDVTAIRGSVSRGIIQAAIAAGEIIETPSAKDDPRFAARGSVQLHDIDAVLCAPIGRPALGVLYLQGRLQGLPDGASFSPVHRDWAALFAAQVGLIAERLKTQWSDDDRIDHTAEVRKRFRCAALIGRSRALSRVLTEAAGMAPLDIGILITGPTGTGKSALARAIHDNSRRAGKPFIAVNCGAVPDTLIESELFGAERGAHSTATQRTVGKVAAAQGGTLFLDEIGELPYDAQATLLQLLQDFQYYPLGASQLVSANVRVLAATNVDLRDAVRKKTFRPDLFYRLNVVTIEMPGLVDRREDIALLVAHFTREACARHGLPPLEVAPSALQAAEAETWTGQIRELANTIEGGAARATAEGSGVLRAHHLFPDQTARDADGPLDLHEATRRFRRRYLLDVLGECDWNIAEATRRLGVARSQVYHLITMFGLKRSGDAT